MLGREKSERYEFEEKWHDARKTYKKQKECKVNFFGKAHEQMNADEP